MKVTMKSVNYLVIPNNITKVEIPRAFNEPIDKDTFNDNISHIFFRGFKFNQKLENLPKGLQN